MRSGSARRLTTWVVVSTSCSAKSARMSPSVKLDRLGGSSSGDGAIGAGDVPWHRNTACDVGCCNIEGRSARVRPKRERLHLHPVAKSSKFGFSARCPVSQLDDGVGSCGCWLSLKCRWP